MARTTTVHLLTGDYSDRLEMAWNAALKAADDKTPLTALEVHPFETLKAEYDNLKAEAIEAGVTVPMAAVGRRTWRTIKEKHPARSGEDVDPEVAKSDRLAGVNTDSVEDDLVYESVKAYEVETEERVEWASTRSAFDEWADKRSEGEWQTLVTRAWELANAARLDPKELPSSPTRSDG